MGMFVVAPSYTYIVAPSHTYIVAPSHTYVYGCYGYKPRCSLWYLCSYVLLAETCCKC